MVATQTSQMEVVEGSGNLPADLWNEEEHDRVAEIFKGRSIFITGGTGFLGKVLVEKLLRSISITITTKYCRMFSKFSKLSILFSFLSV